MLFQRGRIYLLRSPEKAPSWRTWMQLRVRRPFKQLENLAPVPSLESTEDTFEERCEELGQPGAP